MTRPVSDPEYLEVEVELAMARLHLRRGQAELAAAATRQAATAAEGIADAALAAEVVDMTASVLGAADRPETATRPSGAAKAGMGVYVRNVDLI